MTTSNKTPAVVPHLVIRQAAAAIEFYQQAFGAEEVSCLKWEGADTVMHAELKIGSSRLFLTDEMPQMQRWVSPKSLNGTTVTLHIDCEDVDAAFERAQKAGAKVTMPLTDMFWGDRYGRVLDPFGHEWSLSQQVKEMSPEEIQAAAREMFAEQQREAEKVQKT